MKLPLNSGAYQNRSLIAGAQRCVNLFPERNPAEMDPEASFTHYPRPGLKPLGAPPVMGRGRGVFRLSNGDLYAIAGPNVYYVDPNWNFNKIGAIADQFTPVSMADNGQSNGNEAVLVDNTPLGYQVNMSSRQMAQIVDPTGLFTGATRGDFFDTVFTFNEIKTNNFYISLPEQVAFNALDLASKGTFGDPIQVVIVCQRILYLVGTMTTEPWFDAGDPIFPFEETFGQLIPHGTIAPYSVCTTDVSVFQLSQDKDGRGILIKITGYTAKKVSTFALEDEWLTYPRMDDAICYTYQQGGHTFVCIHFPSADKSFGYDLATEQWHQRTWIDQNGTEHRERVAFHAFAYNTNVGQDWQTGQIYALDQKTFTDNLKPIVYTRSFPHIVDEMKRITLNAFVVDLQGGTEANTSEGTQFFSPFSNGFSNGFGPLTEVAAPQIGVRFSKDGGATFSNWRLKSSISAGHNRPLLRWRGIGQGRDIVAEVSWSEPFSTGLNQAFFEAVEHSA